jgi:hypothetical protein
MSESRKSRISCIQKKREKGDQNKHNGNSGNHLPFLSIYQRCRIVSTCRTDACRKSLFHLPFNDKQKPPKSQEKKTEAGSDRKPSAGS